MIVEKRFNKFTFRVITTLFVTLSMICFWLTSLSLWSTNIYKKALLLKQPTIRSEKLKYYKNFYNLLQKASEIDSNKSEYYQQQADKLVLALRNGFLKELEFTNADIEKKYLEAIRYNPADYSNHRKLGLFYQSQKDPKAEKMLLSASKLYPTSFEIHLDLSNFYYENNNSQKGFYSTMRCFNQAFRRGSFSALSKVSLQTQKQIAEVDDISFISDDNAVVYTVYPNVSEIDFKKEGFPHLQIPILFKVYIKNAYSTALLYRDDVEINDFILKETTPEYSVYEFLLKDFSMGSYLDDYKIKSDDYSNIYRIDYVAFLEPVI